MGGDACPSVLRRAVTMDETPISRRYRHGRFGSILGGAGEIMLPIIAKQMGMSTASLG